MFVDVCDKIGNKTKEYFASMETSEIINTNALALYRWSFIVEKSFFLVVRRLRRWRNVTIAMYCSAVTCCDIILIFKNIYVGIS